MGRVRVVTVVPQGYLWWSLAVAVMTFDFGLCVCFFPLLTSGMVFKGSISAICGASTSLSCKIVFFFYLFITNFHDVSVVIIARSIISGRSIKVVVVCISICVVYSLLLVLSDGSVGVAGCAGCWWYGWVGFPNSSSFSIAMAAASHVPVVVHAELCVHCPDTTKKKLFVVTCELIQLNKIPCCTSDIGWMGWISSGSYHTIFDASSSWPSGPKAGWSVMLRWGHSWYGLWVGTTNLLSCWPHHRSMKFLPQWHVLITAILAISQKHCQDKNILVTSLYDTPQSCWWPT